MPPCLEGDIELNVPTPELVGRFQVASSIVCGEPSSLLYPAIEVAHRYGSHVFTQMVWAISGKSLLRNYAQSLKNADYGNAVEPLNP